MSGVIGIRLVLVDGFKKWAIYDFSQNKIFCFNSVFGEFLSSLSATQGSPDTKIEFLRSNYDALYGLLLDSKLVDRLFRPWNSQLTMESYGRRKMWVELTNRCNFKCLHCYSEAGPTNRTCLETGKVLGVVEDAASHGFSAIQFTGGEPLLHPDIDRILSVARQTFPGSIELYSNLSLLSDATLAVLRGTGILVATTMLGSCPEVFDRCSRHPGGFEKWLRGVLKARDSGLKVRVSLVRMKDNQDDIERMTVLLRQYSLLGPDEDAFPDDVRPVGRAHDGIAPDAPNADPRAEELVLEVSEEKWFFGRYLNSCWGGSLAISASGDVFPCVFARSEKLGNVHETTLEEIIQGKAQEYWTVTLDKVEQCGVCEYRFACHDCRAICLNYGRGVYGRPVRCQYDPYNGEIKREFHTRTT